MPLRIVEACQLLGESTADGGRVVDATEVRRRRLFASEGTRLWGLKKPIEKHVFQLSRTSHSHVSGEHSQVFDGHKIFWIKYNEMTDGCKIL